MPSVRPAWTNSRLRSDRNSARVSRAGAGHDTTPTAMVTVVSVEPNTATSTSSSTKFGRVWNASVIAHQHVVDPAAVIAGEGADEDADQDRDGGGDAADQQRDPRAVEDLRGDIAAGIVGAEQEARIGERPDQRPAGQRQRIARIEKAGRDRHRDHDQQQDQAGDGGGAAEIALDRIHRLNPP